MVSYGFIGVEGTGHAFCRHRGWHLHFVGGRTSGFQGGGSLKIAHCSSFRVYGSLRLLRCPSQSRPMQPKRLLDGMMPLRLEKHLG